MLLDEGDSCAICEILEVQCTDPCTGGAPRPGCGDQAKTGSPLSPEESWIARGRSQAEGLHRCMNTLVCIINVRSKRIKENSLLS